MTKDRIKPLLPYAGIPVIATAFLLVSIGRGLDTFAILMLELIIIFGYVATVFDLKTRRIPNSLVLAMLAAWVLAMTPKLLVDTNVAVAILKDSALGFAVGGGLFMLVYLISRKGLGGGDVKFMAAVGLFMGFAGTLAIMLYGTILAALAGIILMILKKIGRKDSITLAPFLYAGILVTVFFR